MINLSVVLVVRNEEHNIEACLKSCNFAKEIIVIDDFSEDNTVQIAEQYGAKIFQRALNGDWGSQQTFALKQATQPWVLLIDADERITPELAIEIKNVVEKNELYSYWIQRNNKFHFNKATHGVLRPDYVLRLAPLQGCTVEGLVHQTVMSPYPSKKLKAKMLHFTYDNWDQYLNKMNKYSTISAEKYRQNGKKCSFFKDIVLRPLWAFIKVYFIQRGFLDGKMGWILSMNHYFYTMNKYVKLYYLQKSNGKL